jgi:hypothetical protein
VGQRDDDVHLPCEVVDRGGEPMEVAAAERTGARLHPHLGGTGSVGCRARCLTDRVERDEAEAHAVGVDDDRAPSLVDVGTGTHPVDRRLVERGERRPEGTRPVVTGVVVRQRQHVETSSREGWQDIVTRRERVTALPRPPVCGQGALEVADRQVS